MRLVVLLAAALVATASAVPAGSARESAGRVIAVYTVKIGVKGGASSQDKHGGTQNGDMVTSSIVHSFTIDGRMPNVVVVGGPPKAGLPATGTGYARATVNGTWTASGTKWVDIVEKVTGPFTCAGTISAHVVPQMSLAWKRAGSVLKFTLAAAQQELYDNGLDRCPSGVGGDPVSGNAPNLYESTFTVPVAAIGRKTITASAGGPLPAARAMMLHNCASVAVKGCSMAWHGVAVLTLTRLTRIP